MKTKSCRLKTLFCFETNIYLRVCLTFDTFFILMIEVSNSPSTYGVPREVSWVGINGGESF